MLHYITEIDLISLFRWVILSINGPSTWYLMPYLCTHNFITKNIWSNKLPCPSNCVSLRVSMALLLPGRQDDANNKQPLQRRNFRAWIQRACSWKCSHCKCTIHQSSLKFTFPWVHDLHAKVSHFICKYLYMYLIQAVIDKKFWAF